MESTEFNPFTPDILPDAVDSNSLDERHESALNRFNPFDDSTPCRDSKPAHLIIASPNRRRIDDAILIEMVNAGTPQTEIAKHFMVSDAAISKALARLRKQATHAAVLEPLTNLQRRFVAEMCRGARQTEAARSAYDCTPDSAKALGNRLMKDERIQRAIGVIMEEQGLSREHLIRRLRQHVDGADAQTSLRAVDMGLKLHDSYPVQKRANVNLNIDTMPVDLSAYM